MKLAIMQPYLLPYIGYFQLIASADRFVLYDNIKYTKKGWINRNRYLRNGDAVTFTLPLGKGSDYLDICERDIAEAFESDKLLNQFREAYRKAPHYRDVFPLLELIFKYDESNLFKFIHHSLEAVCGYLEIATPIVVSSQLAIDHSLQGQEKVLAICEALVADTYINAIGGIELYSRQTFAARQIDLKFIKSRFVEYPQFGSPFVPWLSIIDVMMFNSRNEIAGSMLGQHDLI